MATHDPLVCPSQTSGASAQQQASSGGSSNCGAGQTWNNGDQSGAFQRSSSFTAFSAGGKGPQGGKGGSWSNNQAGNASWKGSTTADHSGNVSWGQAIGGGGGQHHHSSHNGNGCGSGSFDGDDLLSLVWAVTSVHFGVPFSKMAASCNGVVVGMGGCDPFTFAE